MAPNQRLSEREQLAALLEITRQLAAESNLRGVLQLIAEQTTKLLDASRTTIYLIDPITGELWSEIAQESDPIRIAMGQGVAGYVAKVGESLNLRDAHAHPRFDPAFERLTGYEVHTMLAVAIRKRSGEVMGVLQVMNKRNGAFDDGDEELLAALAASAAVAVENAQMHDQMSAMVESFVYTLAATLDARDQQMAGHSQRVTDYAVDLARRLDLSEARTRVLHIAGLLHDYGKIGVPEAILTKPQGLTPAEMAIVQKHVRHTLDILAQIEFTEELQDVPTIAAQHHERLDGSGYPEGITGEHICLESRILAVADVFDALSYPRYYRQAVSFREAYAHLAEQAGTKFDARVVAALGDMVEDLEGAGVSGGDAG